VTILNKQAQLQMGETVFVVFIIIIILVLGLVFYSKAREGEIKENQRDARSKNLIALAHTISSWPELKCSVREVQDYDCIDQTKLSVLSNFITTATTSSDNYAFNYYADFFKKATLKVNMTYPSSGNWVIYDNPSTGGRETVHIPVSIYDSLSNRYSFGIMELTTYDLQ
jgi:hypothetical protein